MERDVDMFVDRGRQHGSALAPVIIRNIGAAAAEADPERGRRNDHARSGPFHEFGVEAPGITSPGKRS